MADLKIPAAAHGQRLDRYLKTARKDLPFIAVQKMIRTGKIRVDGKRCKPDQRLEEGQVVNLPDEGAPRPSAGQGAYQLTNADRKLIDEITLFEDEHLLILNKPAGLAAQAGSGVTRSLDRLLAALYGADAAPKLTHRLDKDTTGLIVLAKTRAAAADITAQFAERKVAKTYLALLAGKLSGEGGDIKAPLAKQAHAHGSRAVVDEGGDHAHTSWLLRKSFENALHLVEATPHTGRMNQLRAHFAHIGCPIVGDDKYGNGVSATAAESLHPEGKTPLYLHAWKLSLAHPATGKTLAVEAPLPPHFAHLTS